MTAAADIMDIMITAMAEATGGADIIAITAAGTAEDTGGTAAGIPAAATLAVVEIPAAVAAAIEPTRLKEGVPQGHIATGTPFTIGIVIDLIDKNAACYSLISPP